MRVNQFRFLTKDDRYDNTPNWSRCYEWCYALTALREDPTLVRVHNTCCGPELIHKFFHDRLVATGREITNSDFVTTPINQTFSRYHEYNILEPKEASFDCVLCISTLEELKDEEKISLAFNNLLNQTREGGRLIITCDYPDVSVSLLERLVGQRCRREGILLSGESSVFQDLRFQHLNVVLIDVTK